MHDVGDLGGGIQAWGGAVVVAGQQVGWWDLGRRVEGVQMPGKTSDDRQPGGPPDRRRTDRLPCPGHRNVDGDGRHSCVLEVVNELQQQPAVPVQLVAQRAAHRQVLLGPSAQRVHDVPPGQGWANAARAAWSTFA